MPGTRRTCFRIYLLKGCFLSRIVGAKGETAPVFSDQTSHTGSTLPDVVGHVEVIVIYSALGQERSVIGLVKSVLLQFAPPMVDQMVQGSKSMNTEIEAVFETRDEAVRKQDTALFLSTQISEIRFGSSAGYLSIEDMTTEVLSVYEECEDSAIVFARETYKPQGKQPRSSFLLYYLIATRKGWKIQRFTGPTAS